MTTIAYDGKTLAADTQMTTSGQMKSRMSKIHPLKNGDVMAGAGCAISLLAVRDWLNAGAKVKAMPDMDAVDILIVRPDGSAYQLCGVYSAHADGDCRPVQMPVEELPFALGSGGVFALAAMKAGKTAVEAVQLASTIDCYTNDVIHAYTVGSVQKKEVQKCRTRNQPRRRASSRSSARRKAA